MRTRYLLPFFLFLGLFFVFGVHLALTQDDGTCQAAVETALSSLEENCSILERNSACYGSGVEAAFTDETIAFASPSDRSSLSQLQTIQTSSFNLDQEQWGAAVMNVAANVPAAMGDGPAVTFVLLGDITIENAVSPDQVAEPVDPIEVTTLLGTNMRSGPGTDARVLTSVGSGTSMLADGLSADQAWLRVIHEGALAWVSRDLVSSESPLDSLPIITPSSLSPMQNFYLLTGSAGCDGTVPSLILIQGPENMDVNLKVNGADIRLGSTMVLWITDDNRMQVLVLSGGAYVGSLSIPAGFSMSIPLSDDGRSTVGNWADFRPMTAAELEQIAFLTGLPQADFLHYAITIPTQGDIQSILTSMSGGGSNGGQASSGPASGQANCSRFQPTSPLDGLAFGSTTFYWDAAPGSTTYRLKVFSASGSLINSYDTNNDNTNLTVDTSAGGIGDGGFFGWEVDALVNGQVACTSSRVNIPRQSAPVLAGGTGGSDNATSTPVDWQGN